MFSPIPEILEDVRQGKMIILVDDESRENEGDLFIPAQFATPEAVNFMARFGRGLICLSLTAEQCDRLQLPPMVNDTDNQTPFGTAFTVSIEARENVTTGISAADRATTIQTTIRPDAKPTDLVRPGHVFPLRAKPGGVLQRAGQTEGSVDLARLPDLETFAAEHGLKLCSIEDIIKYRRQTETLVECVVSTKLPTDYGDFTLSVYETTIDTQHHLALSFGDLHGDTPPLVRVHSECLTGDVFHSRRCDCGLQLHAALEAIGQAGCGVLVYMRQEGRGIGLHNKLRAYALQDQGLDTVEANEKLGFKPDLRDYGIGAQILVDLGIRRMRLLTNNPRKVVGLEGYNLEIVERVAIELPANPHNTAYLKAKRDKLGHLLLQNI